VFIQYVPIDFGLHLFLIALKLPKNQYDIYNDTYKDMSRIYVIIANLIKCCNFAVMDFQG